jgi:hypothetical protein
MTKTALKTLAGATSALLLFSFQALAASPDRVRAEAYFNAISGGNAETIVSFYADNAEFHWIGGPLAGTYNGKTQIKGVWERFSKAAGDIDYKVLELAESKKGARSTVTAKVNFIGPKEVPVRFIMVYENGKIVNEVWEVDKPVVGYAKAEPQAAPAPQGAAGASAAKTETAPPPAAKPGNPAEDERVDTAAAAQDGSATQEAPVQANAAAAEEPEAGTPPAVGTPTPLPPVVVTAPPAPTKKIVEKPTPKKRYAEKKTNKTEFQEYSRRDDDYDEGYEGYSDSDYGYYGRHHRNFGGYGRFGGRGWYGGYGNY